MSSGAMARGTVNTSRFVGGSKALCRSRPEEAVSLMGARSGRGAAQHALFIQQGLQLPRLEHLAHDVAAADELALHVQLGDGGAVAEALDAVAQGLVLQHVDA